MKKILYIHQYFKFPDEIGGTRSYDISSRLTSLGFQVEILSLTSDLKHKGKERWVKVERDGLVVNYIYLPYDNHMSYFKRIMVFLAFSWFSSIKALKIKTDIVLATSTPLTIGIPAMIKKWRQKTPYIFEVRDVWPETAIAIGAINNHIIQKILYKFEKLIYKHAKVIVPLSSDMEQSIISRYPQFKSKIPTIIENISEVDRFQNGFDINKQVLKDKIDFIPRFTILYAGTFGKVNNIEYVINLAEKVSQLDASITFILLGDGAQKKTIEDYAKAKGVLNKEVLILDPVSKSELPQLYSEVDMGSSFVANINELWANSANKFFDTLAASKPILINHGGWQSEIILNSDIGYVLPPVLDEQSIADFVAYTKDIELINRQKHNALEKAKKSYSLDVACEKYKSIIEKSTE